MANEHRESRHRNVRPSPKYQQREKKLPPPPPEGAGTEYEFQGTNLKELGFSGGLVGIRAVVGKRGTVEYLQLSNNAGQSMTIYKSQLDWLLEKIIEARAWEPQPLKNIEEATQ